MNYWLIKSEPASYSIDDLKRDGKTVWTGVRNYQARNYMRDQMKVGDLAIFYHSGDNPPAAVGVARVSKTGVADETAFDRKSDYYDPKSKKENPTWICAEFAFKEKFNSPVTLPQIKFEPKLKGIMVAAKGSRLSVQPVSKEHFDTLLKLSK